MTNTKKSKLLALADIAEGQDRSNDTNQKAFELACAVYSDPNIIHLIMRAIFAESLNAAKELHDAVLPGWNWELSTYYASGEPKAAVFPDGLAMSFEGAAPNLAAAWVAAILRAKAGDA